VSDFDWGALTFVACLLVAFWAAMILYWLHH